MLTPKPGDVLTRYLSSARIPHLVRVVEVDERFIYCSPGEYEPWPKEKCWRFDKRSGAEVDEELGWDGVRVTGSFLELGKEKVRA